MTDGSTKPEGEAPDSASGASPRGPRGPEGSPSGGLPGGPGGPNGLDPAAIAAARRRADLTMGIMLFAFGLVATMFNMVSLTENMLAQQIATLYEQFGVSPYVRPDGLGAVSTVGVIGLPVIYGFFLYIALRRWYAGKRAMWVPLVGAIATFAFTVMLVGAAIALHPTLMDAVMTAQTTGVAPGATPGSSGTPEPTTTPTSAGTPQPASTP